MTREEAKKEMESGQWVTHPRFNGRKYHKDSGEDDNYRYI